MIERNLIDSNITKGIQTKYFAHYKTKINGMQNLNTKSSWSFHSYYNDPIEKTFSKNYEELSKNDFALHKQLINEGVNPNEIAKIIRNDEIEKLQEISSQTNFNYNQTIEPSLYEKCSFINTQNVTLIDYAAFFGSIKCFKYLLMNDANVKNTGKYAIASGNEEIIHLCEQNHSSFVGAYETAIEFHQNDIFEYLYENKLEKFNENFHQNSQIFRNARQQQLKYGNEYQNQSAYGLHNKSLNRNVKQNYIDDLGYICIKRGNYEILLFFFKNGMKINEFVINETVKFSNPYLIKYFLQNNQIPKNILIFNSVLGNDEMLKYLIKQEEIDVNAKDKICFKNLIFHNNIWKLFILFRTVLMIASSNGKIEIVKLLLEQEGIDVNAKGIYLFYLKHVLIIWHFKIIFGNYLYYFKQHL